MKLRLIHLRLITKFTTFARTDSPCEWIVTSERVNAPALNWRWFGIMVLSGEAESGSAGTQPNEE